MNLYYDSEFTGLHQSTTFISLALVADDGREFYAEFTDYDASQCDEWIRANVLAHTRWLNRPEVTPGCWREEALTLCLGDRQQVREALEDWLKQFDQVEIWADCPAWDWVLFCELFGGALKLPANIYYLPFDLVSLFKAKGIDPDIDRTEFVDWNNKGQRQRHNALYDAQLTQACHNKLNNVVKKDNTYYKQLLLDYYHCTFFLPIIGLPEELRPVTAPYIYNWQTEDEDDAQAKLYFSATQADVLFQQKTLGRNSPHPWPVEEWRLDDASVGRLRLRLGKKIFAPGEEKADALLYQIAAFRSVRLYRYFNGIYILAFTVHPEQLSKLKNEQERLRELRLKELAEAYEKEHNNIAEGEALEKLEEDAEDWLVQHNCGVPLFQQECPPTLGEAEEKYGSKAKGYEHLQLEAWLRFTRLARLIYPSFVEQDKEKKISPLRLYEVEGETHKNKYKRLSKDFTQKLPLSIAAHPGENLADFVQVLLGRFFSEKPCAGKLISDLKQLKFDDDRMYVSVAYGLVKKDLAPEEMKRLFSLVLYVDRLDDTWSQLDGWAYTKTAVEERMKQQSLQLWEGLGGYFGYSNYSNAALYSGGFFRDVIAPRHILPIYDRMLLQALFYRASLRMYDNDICGQTGKIVDEDKLGAMQEKRREFIRFTNQYWFHSLTEQMQGKEVFCLQQQALGLKEHYDIIKDELECTDEFLHVRHDIRLGHWGYLVAVLAIYYTLVPIVNDAVVEMGEETSLWKAVGDTLFLGEWGGMALLLLVVPGVILWCFRCLWKKKDLKQ